MGVKKVPKAVQEAREALGMSDMKQLTIEDLFRLDKKQLNNIGNNMRGAFSSDAKALYRKTTDDHERRQWMMQYILDPHATTNKGISTSTTTDGETNKKAGRWMTEAQLAGPDGFNDPAQAKLVCVSGDLEDQEHELPSLAKEGVKQYFFNKQKWIRETGWRKETQVRQEVDLKPEEAEQVMQSMENGNGQASKRQKTAAKPPKPAETEAEKELKNAKLARTLALRKLKAAADKVLADCPGVWEKEAGKIIAKGYPQALADFYKEQIALLKTTAETAHSTYCSEVVKSDQSMDAKACQSSTESATKALEALDQEVGEFKKNKGADLKKLVA